MRGALLFSFLLAALFGCGSGLPDYAKPSRGDTEQGGLEGDLIAYREITKADFRAREPRPEDAEYAERLGAVTCARLLNYPTPRYVIQETEAGFLGYYEELSFVARMDRECSWWNPKASHVPEEYIRQHEQVHFAIAESAARRLNDEARAIVVEFRPTGDTSEEVASQLEGIVRDKFDDAINELLKRNLSFDKDTSNTHAPEKQQEWYDELMSELR